MSCYASEEVLYYLHMMWSIIGWALFAPHRYCSHESGRKMGQWRQFEASWPGRDERWLNEDRPYLQESDRHCPSPDAVYPHGVHMIYQCAHELSKAAIHVHILDAFLEAKHGLCQELRSIMSSSVLTCFFALSVAFRTPNAMCASWWDKIVVLMSCCSLLKCMQ